MVIFHSYVGLPEGKNEDNRTFQICRTHLYRIPNARHTSLCVVGEQSDLHEEITKHKKSLGANSLTTTNKIQQNPTTLISSNKYYWGVTFGSVVESVTKLLLASNI